MLVGGQPFPLAALAAPIAPVPAIRFVGVFARAGVAVPAEETANKLSEKAHYFAAVARTRIFQRSQLFTFFHRSCGVAFLGRESLTAATSSTSSAFTAR